jgi:DNA-binding GntR family transcriptional regulator
MTAHQPQSPANAVIAGWAASPAATKQIAAQLASELTAAPRNDPVASAQKIAARFSVSRSVAVNARNLLQGQGIIRKHGPHYYAT